MKNSIVLIIGFLLSFSNVLFAAKLNKSYINVNGIQYWVEQAGSGKPSIIFFNGVEDSLQSWNDVIPTLSKTQHIFAYDRAGTGKSLPLSDQMTPRTAKGIVRRLQLLLKKARVKPPYILVAHSIGSLYALYFARANPKQVIGVVLLEPSVDAKIALGKINHLTKIQIRKMSKIARQINRNFFNEKNRFINYSQAVKHAPTLQQAARFEYYLENLGKVESQKQIDKLPPLKNIPLIVISGQRGSSDYAQMRRLAAKEIAHSVTDGRYFVIKNAGHDVQNDAPKRVIAAILKISK